ncbi:N-carbamoylputrescine amidase-like isoform X3 [Dioscorea cayenensis subsp. rotundata]|uniref:N-carbamoylputrescine amidase-like isoform X3 n=1 Tax=Dioscorea cayennensis subsp. rotundata TaxID=55577 RepID=A0AB40BC53_DIOCR|nr:N-carbamoylputrescine amidase-like isoform X3 [Dioscorea cayenensis subsp. rotundata]
MEDLRKVMLVALQFACLDSVSKNVATAERLVMGVHKKGANIFLIQVPLVASIKLERRLLKLNMVTAPFPSMAFILGSIGEIVALASIKDKDILGAKFDLNKVKSKRHNWGVFRDRRLKLYKIYIMYSIQSRAL